jgi:hypothetical protein
VAEYIAEFVERRRQQGLVAATPATPALASVPVPEENAGALGFPSDIKYIGEPSKLEDYSLTRGFGTDFTVIRWHTPTVL